MSERNSMRITHTQAINAVQIIMQLAEAAEDGRGLAAELRLGRDSINLIVELANQIRDNDAPSTS